MALATALRNEQRKLAAILDRLKVTPFRRGDFQEGDARGRINEVSVEGSRPMTQGDEFRTLAAAEKAQTDWFSKGEQLEAYNNGCLLERGEPVERVYDINPRGDV